MTKNFSKSEFDCKCGCEIPHDVYVNIVKLANQLQHFRDIINKPITINSGYRCEAHNKKIGGVKYSQHVLGKAADIVVQDLDPVFVIGFIDTEIQNGDMLQGGLGLYNTFVHYDIRGKRARWDFRVL